MARALTEEDRRAIEWQARQKRIAANTKAREAKLTGSASYAQTIRDNWEPFIQARRDAQMDYEEPDCEENA